MKSKVPHPRVYVYDDLGETLKISIATLNIKLAIKLFRLKLALIKNKNVHIIHTHKLISTIATSLRYTTKFDLTLAISDSGSKIAAQLHKKTGRFPKIHTIPLTRNEIANNEYIIVNESNITIQDIISLYTPRSLAIVDDTLYSGKTLRSILEELPLALQKKTQFFCLQAIQESAQALSLNITTGFTYSGKRDSDVSIIKASGLFTRGAIKRKGLGNMAFYERSVWMKSWFPKNADYVRQLSSEINQVLLRPNTNKIQQNYDIFTQAKNIFNNPALEENNVQ